MKWTLSEVSIHKNKKSVVSLIYYRNIYTYYSIFQYFLPKINAEQLENFLCSYLAADIQWIANLG